MGRVIRIWQEEGRTRSGPPVRNDRFTPVIDLVRRLNALDRPFLVPIKYTRTQAEAEDVRKSLYSTARYYCSCGQRYCTRRHNNLDGCPNGGQRISCRASLVRDSEGRLRVQFTLHDKREAMRALVDKYGPDRSKWPYDPWAKKEKSS